MKILYSLNSAEVGGAEQHVLQLVGGFSKNNEVFVVCPEGELVEKYLEAGAVVIIDRPSSDIDFKYIFRLKKILTDNNIDILHTHQLKTVINSLLGAKLAGTPVRIAHIHSPIIHWEIPLYKKIPNLVANYFVVNILATKVIALTNTIRKQRILGEGINPRKIEVIPNGIEVSLLRDGRPREVIRDEFCEEYELDTTKILMGTLSRLTQEKGVDVFIKGIKEFDRRFPQWMEKTQFLIAGKGTLKEKILRNVKQGNLEERVRLLDFLPEEIKKNYYRSLDIYVFPSKHEGFGYVLAEAMYCKTITLSSDLPVLRELTKNGKYGYHFKKNNAKDLAKELNEILIQKEQAQLRANKASIYIEENYSYKQFIEKYASLYTKLLKKT